MNGDAGAMQATFGLVRRHDVFIVDGPQEGIGAPTPEVFLLRRERPEVLRQRAPGPDRVAGRVTEALWRHLGRRNDRICHIDAEEFVSVPRKAAKYVAVSAWRGGEQSCEIRPRSRFSLPYQRLRFFPPREFAASNFSSATCSYRTRSGALAEPFFLFVSKGFSRRDRPPETGKMPEIGL